MNFLWKKGVATFSEISTAGLSISAIMIIFQILATQPIFVHDKELHMRPLWQPGLFTWDIPEVATFVVPNKWPPVKFQSSDKLNKTPNGHLNCFHEVEANKCIIFYWPAVSFIFQKRRSLRKEAHRWGTALHKLIFKNIVS